MFAKKMELELSKDSELGELMKVSISGPDGPDVRQAQTHIQEVVQLLFEDGQITLARIAVAFAYAYRVCRWD